MAESLDNILSGQKSTPETIEKEKPVEAVETPAETTTETPEATGEQPAGQKMVPHEALHAEKQKVKRYTEQVASFEETLKQRDQAWERRFEQLVTAVKPQQPAQPLRDWFENPDEAYQQRSQATLDPVMRGIQSLQSKIARFEAREVFGDKLSDFMTLISTGKRSGDPWVNALEAAMDASDQPYSVAKQWFDQRTFDPEAERARIREELTKELQPQQPHTPAAPVMPSNLAGARNVGNRSGPQWAGPPKLDDIFKR